MCNLSKNKEKYAYEHEGNPKKSEMFPSLIAMKIQGKLYHLCQQVHSNLKNV